MRRIAAVLVVLLCLAPVAARAQADLIVEKKTFELPSYTTAAGAVIKNVKIGWEWARCRPMNGPRAIPTCSSA